MFLVLRKNLFLIAFFVTAILANLGSPSLAYISMACAVIQMFLYDEEKNFYFGCLLLPMLGVFDVTEITYLANIIVAVPFVIYLLRNRLSFKAFPLISTLFLFIVEMLHIVALDNKENLVGNISCFLSMIYCLCITLDENIDLKLDRIVRHLSIGIILSALIYLYCNDYFDTDIVEGVVRGDRLAAFSRDPNYYALFICVAVASLLALKKHIIFDYVFLGVLVILGFLTGSRMCFLLLVFTLSIGLIYNAAKFKNKSRTRFFRGIVVILAASLMRFSDKVRILIDSMLERSGMDGGRNSSSVDLTQATAGRTDILEDYFAILSSNFSCLIFGYGLQYHQFLNTNEGAGAHNTYLDVILAWGIIGVLAMIYIVFTWYRKHSKLFEMEEDWIAKMPIIVLAINFFDLSCLGATMFWWVIAIVFLATRKQTVEG